MMSTYDIRYGVLFRVFFYFHLKYLITTSQHFKMTTQSISGSFFKYLSDAVPCYDGVYHVYVTHVTWRRVTHKLILNIYKLNRKFQVSIEIVNKDRQVLAWRYFTTANNNNDTRNKSHNNLKIMIWFKLKQSNDILAKCHNFLFLIPAIEQWIEVNALFFYKKIFFDRKDVESEYYSLYFCDRNRKKHTNLTSTCFFAQHFFENISK